MTMWIGGGALLALVALGVAVVAQGGGWQADAPRMPMGGGMPMHDAASMPMDGNTTMRHDPARCPSGNVTHVPTGMGSELMWGAMAG